MHIFKMGAIYFAIVFATGFVLGIIRTLWLVPHLGVRNAELLEMPFMLTAIVLAATWIGAHLHREAAGATRIAIGVLALALLLSAEIIVGVSLQGLSVVEVFTKHDPISGSVYYAMLGVFAVMPWLLWKYFSHAPASP
jgi:hypothetical protein